MFGAKKRGEPVRRLESDLAHFAERRNALEARRRALEDEGAAARDERRRLLVDGDDTDAVTALEQRVLAAETGLAGVHDALSEVNQREEAARSELATLQAKAAREVAAAALTADIATAEAALEQFTGAVGQLDAALQKLENADILAVQNYLRQALEAVPAATIIGFDCLRRIISDENKPIPQPQQARPRPAAPRPPTRRVCPKQNIKYADASGAVVTIGRGWDCDLPAHLAERAIERGLAVDPATDEAKRLRFQRGGFGAAAATCYDLNDETAPAPKPVPRLPIDRIGTPTESFLGTGTVRGNLS